MLRRLKKIQLYIAGHYALDLRALSLMRIGLALVVIADLLIRLPDLNAHYSDDGTWPRELLHNFGWNGGYWSFHSLGGSVHFELFLFILHFVFALLVLFGFRTRISTCLLWLFTISLHNRNIFVLQSGDDLLRLILLWGIFLPWGARYSWDSKKNKTEPRQNIPANLGYLILIASVYFFSANLKTDPEWHGAGTAVYYALSLEQLRLPAGDLIYPYTTLQKILTWLVFYSEYLVALLVLLPSKRGTVRLIAFFILLLLHAGIGLTLYVGLFFVIGMTSALGLIPTYAMDWLEKKFKFLGQESKTSLESVQAVAIAIGTRTTGTNTKLNEQRVIEPFVRVTNTFVCGLLIFLCLMMNLGTVQWFPYELNNELAYPSNALRLNQYWGMFSPGVLKKDGWYVFHGMDSLGRQWDLRRNDEYVDYGKPGRIVSLYRSDRWRKLAENMQSDKYTFLRPLYCKYILHYWNRHHPEKKLFTLRIYFMEKENLLDHKSTEPVKVLHCLCYDH